MDKFCDQVQLKQGEKRKGYRLKSELPTSAEIKTVEAKIQTTIFGNDEITANIGHNDAIAFLAKYAARLGYDIHVGETEQRKLPNFRDISHQMLSAVDYGINPKAFDIIKEIDLLWMKGKKIIAAFEVATSIDTADKAINVRYRNLFASMPGIEIKTFVIVRDKDYKKAEEKLYTPVNLQDGICDKIKTIKISEMTFENIEKEV